VRHTRWYLHFHRSTKGPASMLRTCLKLKTRRLRATVAMILPVDTPPYRLWSLSDKSAKDYRPSPPNYPVDLS
jgi:hypothetical protein